MFFVISGFIIPYSLYKAGYRRGDFGRFLLKRIARLDPPYFATILRCLALSYVVTLAPGFRGAPPHYTWQQLAAHVAYLNSFVHLGWLNVVLSWHYRWPFAANRWCSYLPVFVAGMLAFQSRAGLISTRALLAGLAATAVAGPIACVGIATALGIRFVELPASRLTGLGAISYSLYLLHVPVGGKILNLGGRVAHSTGAIASLLAVAVGASIVAAAIFNRWVELPSQRLSASIRYRD